MDDDRFLCYENFSDDDDSDDMSNCSNRKPNIKDMLNSIDKNRHIIFNKIKKIDRTDKKKRTRIVFYTTKYTTNSLIRNAVSGNYQYESFVGKKNEINFFKVSLTGVLGQNPDTKHLYYDSPHQYEEHFNVTLDKSIIDKWNIENQHLLAI